MNAKEYFNNIPCPNCGEKKNTITGLSFSSDPGAEAEAEYNFLCQVCGSRHSFTRIIRIKDEIKEALTLLEDRYK